MIGDISTIAPAERVCGDVCVVGTGPAGMEAIRYLRRNGLRVVVAEGGRRDFSKETQERLTRVENVGRRVREPDPHCTITPYLAPEHRGEGRLRQFGGNANIWTGKWREFEPFDFTERAHVPGSGWPIDFSDMLPLYREIQGEYGFGDFSAVGADPAARRFMDATAGSPIRTTFHYWEAEPLRVAKKFGDALAADPGVRIILGANAVELLQSPDGNRVTGVRCRSLEGAEIVIEASSFVIATGGIETPRLLLNSNRVSPAGIGNEHDLVGRYFMDHPKLKAGRFTPGPLFAQLPGGAAVFPRPRFKPCFSLSPEAQEQHGLLNHIVQFAPLPPKGDGTILERARRRARSILGPLRGALESSAAGPFKSTFIFEQAPNRDSRVTLSEQRDALGVRKPRLDWRLNALDASSFRTTIEILCTELEAAGIGRIDFGEEEPSLEDTVDCRHHIGTTRMGRTPREGVVDADGRVFGTDNLYIAGSAVFPTGHSYGPTLTIVVLARRTCKALLARRQPAAEAG